MPAAAAESETLEYTARNLPLLEIGDLDQSGDGNRSFGREPVHLPSAPDPDAEFDAASDSGKPPDPASATDTDAEAGQGRLTASGNGRRRPSTGSTSAISGRRRCWWRRFAKRARMSVEIEIATVGDVLDDIYIVRAIGLESVKIGFVGYDASEDTSVPLSDK